jgi:hypothetical protein
LRDNEDINNNGNDVNDADNDDGDDDDDDDDDDNDDNDDDNDNDDDDDDDDDDDNVGDDTGSAAGGSCSQDGHVNMHSYELGIARRAIAKVGSGQRSGQRTQQLPLMRAAKASSGWQ